ncbi:MAG: cycloinulo-oligosaccharide fructanotransferase, partial [Planctomycetales bacterium]|nr:cycloinulo-oligosaccharide fructanotransferase [Planctomycetales bacterium]
MKYSALLLLCFVSPIQAADWSLDDINDTVIVHGGAKAASGVAGQSLVLDGESLIELKESAQLTHDVFTVSVWFNPYHLSGGQQILAGKNRYSRNERQWSLTIEPNGKLKAYLRQNDWRVISCDVSLVAGQWHLATLVVESDKASLFLNGKPVGEVQLRIPIAATPAPITLGGIWDMETVRQPFHGALDEFSYEPRAWSDKEIAAAYRPISAKHDVPKLSAGLPLWDDSQELPKAAELPLVRGAEFHVIKEKRPDADGCRWTLGVGLAWHKGQLYASYGFNKGSENTPTEEAHVRVSRDGGKTWGHPVVMDAGEGNLGVSHGVFLSHGGRLWAFMGAFYDNRQRTHTRAYLLNETSGQWEPHGIVIDEGF